MKRDEFKFEVLIKIIYYMNKKYLSINFLKIDKCME